MITSRVVAGWWDWLIDGSCWFAGVVAGFLCIMPFRLLFSFFFSEIMYILFTIRRRSRSISMEVREMLEGGV